jgi:hypothetical protein
MSDGNIPNELTTLKTEMQKDVEVDRDRASFEKKSEWIQVSARGWSEQSTEGKS